MIDRVNQFILAIVFEDLCAKLQHLKVHDVIAALESTKSRIDVSSLQIRYKMYMEAPILNLEQKRNNFFFIGDSLRCLLSGLKVNCSSPSVKAYKDFIECSKDDARDNWR